ncbi:MAG: phosphopantothenoylcysteine decarboxylase [Planctomycetes bacterium]|nr:phosphopantothenoylcysteine decarboxylase [Planctomycetota bacterium]
MANKKLHFLITAGGTREYIDPVRFISNASSGQMGIALARAALQAGHTVTLITAPTALKPPKEAQIIAVQTSEQMFCAVKDVFSDCDILIMAAAVSDYKPAKTSPFKLKKQQNELVLHLVPTRDILAWAGRHKQPTQRVVGFALEDRDLFANAEEKLRKKHLDMIVANAPTAIGANASVLHVKTPDSEWQTLPWADKIRHADELIKMIEYLSRKATNNP